MFSEMQAQQRIERLKKRRDTLEIWSVDYQSALGREPAGADRHVIHKIYRVIAAYDREIAKAEKMLSDSGR
jgi:hypothetical protein